MAGSARYPPSVATVTILLGSLVHIKQQHYRLHKQAMEESLLCLDLQGQLLGVAWQRLGAQLQPLGARLQENL